MAKVISADFRTAVLILLLCCCVSGVISEDSWCEAGSPDCKAGSNQYPPGFAPDEFGSIALLQRHRAMTMEEEATQQHRPIHIPLSSESGGATVVDPNASSSAEAKNVVVDQIEKKASTMPQAGGFAAWVDDDDEGDFEAGFASVAQKSSLAATEYATDVKLGEDVAADSSDVPLFDGGTPMVLSASHTAQNSSDVPLFDGGIPMVVSANDTARAGLELFANRGFVELNSTLLRRDSDATLLLQHGAAVSAEELINEDALTEAMPLRATADADAALFLMQATFGPTRSSVDYVKRIGVKSWLEEQLNLPVESHREYFRARSNPTYNTTAMLDRNLNRSACEKGSRWHQTAFSRADEGKHLEVVGGNIFVDGLKRTEIDPDFVGNGLVKPTTCTDVSGLWFGSRTCAQEVSPHYARCGNSEEYKASTLCQQTCFDKGLGYEGDDCSVGWPSLSSSMFDGYICELKGNGIGQWMTIGTSRHCFSTQTMLNPAIWLVDISEAYIVDSRYVFRSSAKVPDTLFLATAQPACGLDEVHFLEVRGKIFRYDSRMALYENTIENPQTVGLDLAGCTEKSFVNEDSCIPLSHGSPCDMACGSVGEIPNSPVMGNQFPFLTNEYNVTTTWTAQRHFQYNVFAQLGQLSADYNLDNSHNVFGIGEAKTATWTMHALNATGQLRQRMAWALSQIIGVSETDLGWSNEMFLYFYDIFVRHALGNYRDVLRHVTYSPVMANFLTYLASQSFDEDGSPPDENYAREIVQSFTIGVVKLHLNGTVVTDKDGVGVPTCSNEHITNFARVFTGFVQQQRRNNTEQKHPRQNWIDPLRMKASAHDVYPKPDLDGGYLGDGYPLCADKPTRAFLHMGAKYEFIGYTWYRGLIESDNSDVYDVFTPRNSSELFTALCGHEQQCKYAMTVHLTQDVECDFKECALDSVAYVKVGDAYYEYVEPPCVHSFFYQGKMADKANTKGRHANGACLDPSSEVASAACCSPCQDLLQETTGCTPGSWVTNATCSHQHQNIRYSTAEAHCRSLGMHVCGQTHMGTCYNSRRRAVNYLWTEEDCFINLMVHGDGKVTGHTYQKENRFTTYWTNDEHPAWGKYYNASVETAAAFDYVPSVQELKDKLKVGAWPPRGPCTHQCRIQEEVKAYANAIGAPIDETTVFECDGRFFKNVISSVHVGKFNFRNPPSFLRPGPKNNRKNTEREWQRASYYEVEALIDHLLHHPNTPVFVTKKLLQRFTTSSPSAAYQTAVANAFKTGTYDGITYSGRYGDLKATVMAIFLHPEARSRMADTDGMLREPMLKLIHFLRAMEYNHAEDDFINLDPGLADVIGQFPYHTPTAEILAPESQIFTPPYVMGFLNGMASLLEDKRGLQYCNGGFGRYDGPGCHRHRGRLTFGDTFVSAAAATIPLAGILERESPTKAYTLFGSGSCRATSLSDKPHDWYTQLHNFEGTLDDCKDACNHDETCLAFDFKGDGLLCELWSTRPQAVFINEHQACYAVKGESSGDIALPELDTASPMAPLSAAQTVALSSSYKLRKQACKLTHQLHDGVDWCDIFDTLMSEYQYSDIEPGPDYTGPGVWYYSGISTDVGYGANDQDCNRALLYCAGGNTFGTGEEQVKAIMMAIDNGGRHPYAPVTTIPSSSHLQKAIAEWKYDRASAWRKYGTIYWWNVSAVTRMASLFEKKHTFNDAIGAWDTSRVTNMQSMFAGASAFNQDISAWNTANNERMMYMFAHASAFNQDISSWNTAQITKLQGTFQDATSFNQPLRTWDVSRATNMCKTFRGATAFNQALDAWDVSQVENMSGILSWTNAFNQPLATWNTARVMDMRALFQSATAFNQPLSTWETGNVTDMSRVFYNAHDFDQSIYTWSVSRVTDMSHIFSGTPLSGCNKRSIYRTWSSHPSFWDEFSDFGTSPCEVMALQLLQSENVSSTSAVDATDNQSRTVSLNATSARDANTADSRPILWEETGEPQWPQRGNDYMQCDGSDEIQGYDAANVQECQRRAQKNGHPYYQFEEKRGECKTLATCYVFVFADRGWKIFHSPAVADGFSLSEAPALTASSSNAVSASLPTSNQLRMPAAHSTIHDITVSSVPTSVESEMQSLIDSSFNVDLEMSELMSDADSDREETLRIDAFDQQRMEMQDDVYSNRHTFNWTASGLPASASDFTWESLKGWTLEASSTHPHKKLEDLKLLNSQMWHCYGKGNHQWIKMTSGAPVTVGGFRVKTPGSWDRAVFKDYFFEYSDDGKQWHIASEGQGKIQDWQTITFHPRTGTYWRLYMVNNWGYGWLALEYLELLTPQGAKKMQRALTEMDVLLTGGRLTPTNVGVVRAAYHSAPAGEQMAAAQHAILLTPEFNNLGDPRPSGNRPVKPVELAKSPREPYKALVIVFLAGGADTFHMLVPIGCPLYDEYKVRRKGMVHEQDKVLPINALTQHCKKFGIHPELKFVHDMYSQRKKASFVSNIGALVQPLTREQFLKGGRTCLGMFSHSHQQAAAQTLQCQVPGAAPRGVGGRMADEFAKQGMRTTSFSLAGAPIWSQGFDTNMQIIDSKRGSVRFSSYDRWSYAISNLTSQKFGNRYIEEYAQAFQQAIETSETVADQLENAKLETSWNPSTDLSKQLYQVAKLIATRESRGAERDVFFVQLGGFDTHQDAHEVTSLLFKEIDQSLRDFVAELEAQQVFDDIVIATESEFGRTFGFHGGGTDHGWGGNHIVLGGNVNGGNIFNEFITSYSEGVSHDAGNGRVIPKYPWESMLVPIAEWMGIPESKTLFPNLQNFNRSNHIIPNLFNK